MGFGAQSYPQTQTQTVQLSPAQQSLQNAAAQYLQGQVGQLGPNYPGQFTAGLSQPQATSIGQLGALGQMSTGPQAAGFNTLGNYAQGNYLNDPFAAAALGTTAQYAQQQFKNAIPSLQSQFIQAGQTGFSSPENQYLANADATFQLGLQNQLAQQALGQYNQQQQNQLQAATGVIPLGQSAAQTGLTALTMPQQVQQAELNAQYQNFLRQQQNPWAAVTGGAASLIGQPQGQTNTGTVYGPSPFAQVTNALSSLAPLAFMFM